MSEYKSVIAIGYRVGKLTVTERTEQRKSRYTVWRCRCDCGGIIELDTRCLQRGTVTDCGCISIVKPGMLDLTGQRFGKLVCLKPFEERDNHGNTQWLCQCDCGNICLASVHQLRAGYKKSCGCLSHPKLKELVGKRYGKLTVTGYAGKVDGMHRWKCLCDCGNETVVGQTLLESGKTKSCGCMRLEKLPDAVGFVDGTSLSAIRYYADNLCPRNTSGCNGVYFNKKNNKWCAQITFRNKTYYLGSFGDFAEAVKARKCGEEMYDEFLLKHSSESYVDDI